MTCDARYSAKHEIKPGTHTHTHTYLHRAVVADARKPRGNGEGDAADGARQRRARHAYRPDDLVARGAERWEDVLGPEHNRSARRRRRQQHTSASPPASHHRRTPRHAAVTRANAHLARSSFPVPVVTPTHAAAAAAAAPAPASFTATTLAASVRSM